MDENHIRPAVLQAALAGLLHDVGKVEQRAADDPRFPPQGTSREGQPVHAAFTQAFMDGLPSQYRAAARAGVYHHNPQASPAEDKHLSELVALADKLSAGERADTPHEKGDYPNQMVTIFDRVYERRNATAPEQFHYLPLRLLELSHEAIFPGAKPQKDNRDAYITLRDFLRREARREIADPEIYVENVLAAMQQAAWCVPSAYYHSVPDVSLYDHARMTAALAVCLAQRPADEIHTLLGAVERGFWGKPESGDAALLDKPIALLIGGDISGVQDFIYTISSKGAAKTLRGRSFYLQLLTEAALRFVLKRLELPYTNVIYAGGGNFFLLAPAEAQEKLPALRAELTRILLKHHGTSLYLAIGATAVSATGFKAGKHAEKDKPAISSQLPKYWNAMHKALQQAKQMRYSELGEEAYALVFKPPEWGGNPNQTCSVCEDDQRKTRKWDEQEAQARICQLCESFADEIGKSLPHSRFVALGWITPEENEPSTASAALAELGMTFELLESAQQKVALKAERLTIWALDDPKDGKYPPADAPAAHTLHYVANQIPRVQNQAEADAINKKLGKVPQHEKAEAGQQKTFEHLLVQVEGGFQKLGVIRLDVDDVGELFKKGLGDELPTLSRLAALSFQLSLFFEGWMKVICAQDGLDALVYTVYTGGDDAFLLGPWDRMPALAQEIARQFDAYTGKHPKLHMSTGMSFIGGKYPIYQAADDAHDKLEDAKKSGKNAFHFLGKSWKWAEFAQIKAKQERVVEIVDEKQLNGPQAILQTLRTLAEQKSRKQKTNGKDVWGPWQWRGAYLLKRMEEREKARPALMQAIGAIRNELDQDNYSQLDQWGTAARWAQLATRKDRDREDDKL